MSDQVQVIAARLTRDLPGEVLRAWVTDGSLPVEQDAAVWLDQAARTCGADQLRAALTGLLEPQRPRRTRKAVEVDDVDVD